MMVFVKGVGMTRFGEHWDKDLRDLAIEAAVKAMDDAEVSRDEIDGIIVGNMDAGRFTGQSHLGSLLASELGLTPKEALRVEGACASGGLSIRQGVLWVKSGLFKHVLVVGVEKMCDVTTGETALILSGAGDAKWEAFYGATFPSLYALVARRHMYEFGTTEEQMAEVAVKNHYHGSMNPFAQFQREISKEDVLESQYVADPLKILDCSPITDGAAAVVLSSKKTDVEIIGSACATDELSLHNRETITTFRSTVEATKRALNQARIDISKIQVAEVHDCFTIAELLAVEDIGFVEKGKSGKEYEEGRFRLGDSIVINPSGGLKACGHPVGATGVKQIVELTLQLREEAGKRQVNAEYGLAHNVGGTGGTCVIHILRRV